jgi:beta-lactamase regulating signal transducer with metallopeptidase domain
MNAVIEFLNAAGAWFIAFALPMLIQSSVLILLILGIDLLIRKRVRAVFRYGLWMLVLIKLMLPTSLSAPTGLGYWFGIPMPQIPQPSEISTPPVQEPITLLMENPLEPIFPEPVEPIQFPTAAEMMMVETPPANPRINQNEPLAAATPTSAPAPIEPTPKFTWQAIVFLVWLLIVLILVLLLVQRVFFVRQLVAQAKDAKGTVIAVFNQCREKLGIHKTIPIKLSVNAAGPSVCGLVRPVILFPYSLLHQLNREERESILLHELAHIKRRDLWVNLLQTILQIFYFFHPLLWLANAMIRRIREQAVDEAVLVAMDREAEEYSNTLVRVFRMSLQRPTLSLRLIGVVESKTSLTTRIKHMLSRPLPKSAKLGILGVLTVFLLGAILLPMAEARRMQEKTLAAVSAETTDPDENLQMDLAPDDPRKGARVDFVPEAESITETSVAWGKPVQGMQVGIWMDKKRWRIGGDVLRVNVEVRINDQKRFQESGLNTKLVDRYPFKLQIDDGIPLGDRTRYTTIRTGMQVPLRRSFKAVLYLDDYVWERKEPSFLNPGRHKIRIHFVGLGPSISSGSVEIELLPKETKKLESWPHPWGKAVAGVQVSAHPVKPSWPVGSEPVIRIRLRNQGGINLPIHLWPNSFALEVDGKRYENNFIFHAWPRPFGLGTEYEYDLKLSKSRPFHDGLRKGNTWPPVGKPPPLFPGKHTVRVLFTEWNMLSEPTSNPVEIEIQSALEEEVTWGKPVEGVQCRLQPKRTAWHVREAPQFLVFPRAVDENADLLLSSSVLYGSQVEVDGKWYDYWAPQEFVGPAYISCQEWQAREQGLDLTLTPHQYHSVEEKRSLHLPVGKHKVRFAWAAYRSDYKTNPPKKRPPLQVISNPVEIEIVPIENDILQQQGGKYFHDAQTSAQGSPKNPEYTIECIRKALQYPQSDINQAQLYIYWGDMIQIQTPNYRPEVWAPQRKKAAEIYLEGLHDILKHSLPENPPEFPVVERFTVDGPPEIVERYRKINELQVQLRKETMRIHELIQHRQALTGQLVQMYAREPDAFGELQELVVRYLNSNQAAQQIIAAVKDYRKNPKPPFPAIVLESDRDYQFWGNPVDGVQCRLRAEKSTWPQGSIPKLFADLRNRGQQNLRIAIESESWELEIDGQWHKPDNFFSGSRRYLPLGPGQLQRDMEVWLPTVDNLAHQFQALKPGKHTIRIARLFNDPWRPGDEVLRVVSNPIQIQIVSDVMAASALPKQVYLNDLLENAPVSTKYAELEIFEKVPDMAGEYRIRSDVKRIQIPSAISNPLFSAGEIFYLPQKNAFYIQSDPAGASTLHYYGPFQGNPDEIEIILTGGDVFQKAAGSRIRVQVLDHKGKPVTGTMVELQKFAGGDVDNMENYDAEWIVTNDQGCYVFEDVTAKSIHIGPSFKTKDNPAPNVPYGLLFDLEIEPGRDYSVTLGGKGRPVIGRLVPASGKDGDIDWSKAWADFTLRAAPFSMGFWEANAKIHQAMVKAEGGDFYHKGVTINPDGTFRIENVRAGHYMFRVKVQEESKREGLNLFRDIRIPLMRDGTSDTPFNLSTLPVSHGDYKAPRFIENDYLGTLVFNKELPIKLLAGNDEQPDVVSAEDIQFSKDGDTITAALNLVLKSVVEAKWRARLELVTENGSSEARDDVIFETSKLILGYPVYVKKTLHISLGRHSNLSIIPRFRLSIQPLRDELVDNTRISASRDPTAEIDAPTPSITGAVIGTDDQPAGEYRVTALPRVWSSNTKDQIAWGKAGKGVQVRLRTAKRIWNQGDDPSFKVDFRNTGTRELKTSQLASLALEIDGKPYAPRIWGYRGTIGVMPFGPGKEYSLEIKLSQFAADRKSANELPPGLHTIKAVYLDNNSANGRGLTTSLNRYQEMALAYSDPVEISIILAEHKWGPPTNGLRAAVEFIPEKASYTQGESVAVRFHVQNVSDRAIEFKSQSIRWDWPLVKDRNGKDVKVLRYEHFVMGTEINHVIKPKEVLVLNTYGLGFIEFDDQSLNMINENKGYFIGSVLCSKPGEYAIHYQVNSTLKTGVRKITIDEKPQIELNQVSMKQAIETLARKYRARLCFEDIVPDTGADSAAEPYRLTGRFKASTIPKLLDQLTQSGPFAWVKYNDTYVVYPRKNSLLESSVSINISGPLESVARKVLDKIPAGKEIEIKIPADSVVPYANKKKNIQHLWISSSPARYALSRAVEESGQGDTEIVWSFTQEQGRKHLTLHYLPPPTALAP